MANKYAATCYRCGGHIAPGAGVFEKSSKAQRDKWPGEWLPNWLAQHHECVVKFRGTKRHYKYAPDA